MRTPSNEELEALKRFAAKHGRLWKSALGHAWETGRYDSDDVSDKLQTIRNAFGPSWLVRFRFPRQLPPAGRWCNCGRRWPCECGAGIFKDTRAGA